MFEVLCCSSHAAVHVDCVCGNHLQGGFPEVGLPGESENADVILKVLPFPLLWESGCAVLHKECVRLSFPPQPCQ